MNTPEMAVSFARQRINTGTYWLGTGDCDTPLGGRSDCFGFAFNFCYGIRRHRPGFNAGPWASVSDDLNCNSAIEDAQHKQELFTEVPDLANVQLGDLLAYPTFRLRDEHGVPHQYIGHICIVDYIPKNGARYYGDLGVVQCCGPNGHQPGIIGTDGSHWDQHNHVWPLPQHRTHILRPIRGRS
jgi:hypothetical protein